MSEQIYVKNGKRYLKYGLRWDRQNLPYGNHMVICQPGCEVRLYNVEPDKAGLIAAAHPIKEEIVKFILKKMEMRPSRRTVTPAQKAAWDNLVKEMGDDRFVVEYASIQEIVDHTLNMIIGGTGQ